MRSCVGRLPVLICAVAVLAGCVSSRTGSAAKLVGTDGISDVLEVFQVDKKKPYVVEGVERTVGAGFQPSVTADDKGNIHVFFQARLDSSDDRAEKLIGHVVSRDFGRTFSDIRFVNSVPMQTYAISAYTRKSPSGKPRISLLTSLSIDETIDRLKAPASIKERLGIDVTTFSRRAATVILEYYSDDGGDTWNRKEHMGVADRVYERNGRDYYLAFINCIGQVRRIEAGPFAGRLILGGPLRGDYLPCPDHPHFRDYPPSSSLIFSDDDGESWQFGGVVSDETAFENNEGSATPVDGGRRILLARRRNKAPATGKIMHHSDDGGATWGPGFETSVAATRCLQVLESHGDLVLCSAPGTRNRANGRIYVSRDAGKTWTWKLVDKGAFSYSTVNRLTGDYLICCYSRGHHGEHGIAARIFSVDWLNTE
ncbi:MAG: exo-alpha-sialidase [bacterium]|nr:exo-alpha-sialidase [bacterium]